MCMHLIEEHDIDRHEQHECDKCHVVLLYQGPYKKIMMNIAGLSIPGFCCG